MTSRPALILLALLTAACETGTSPSAPTGTAIERSAPTVAAILIEPDRVTPAAGRSTRYTATARFSDGSKEDVTASADWNSSNPAVATVEAGLVQWVQSGESMLTASYRGTRGQLFVAVTIFEAGAAER